MEKLYSFYVNIHTLIGQGTQSFLHCDIFQNSHSVLVQSFENLKFICLPSFFITIIWFSSRKFFWLHLKLTIPNLLGPIGPNKLGTGTGTGTAAVLNLLALATLGDTREESAR